MWVVVKNNVVPFCIPIIIRHLIFRYPKRDCNLDNHPCEVLKRNLSWQPGLFVHKRSYVFTALQALEGTTSFPFLVVPRERSCSAGSFCNQLSRNLIAGAG